MTPNVRPPEVLADKDVSEADVITFDYSKDLQPFETLTSATVTVNVLSGTDNNPGAMKIGSASVFHAMAMQKVFGGVAGTKYSFRCVATTTNNRQLVCVGVMNVVNL